MGATGDMGSGSRRIAGLCKPKRLRLGALALSGGERGIVAARPHLRLRRCLSQTGLKSRLRSGQNTKEGPDGAFFVFLAEREGFEPSVRYHRTLAFQASTLNHSAISPLSFLPSRSRGMIRRLRRLTRQAGAHSLRSLRVCRPAAPTSVRTLGTVSPYTRFPGEHLKPLSHLSDIRCAPLWKGGHSPPAGQKRRQSGLDQVSTSVPTRLSPIFSVGGLSRHP